MTNFFHGWRSITEFASPVDAMEAAISIQKEVIANAKEVKILLLNLELASILVT